MQCLQPARHLQKHFANIYSVDRGSIFTSFLQMRNLEQQSTLSMATELGSGVGRQTQAIGMRSVFLAPAPRHH